VRCGVLIANGPIRAAAHHARAATHHERADRYVTGQRGLVGECERFAQEALITLTQREQRLPW
jgi:hypothetical protein